MRLLLLVALAACVAPAPSDDPAAWEVDTSIEWIPRVSEPRWIVPGPGVPAELSVGNANNNVDIELFEDRIFLAWRTSRDHWASPDSLLQVMSSADDGVTWETELQVALGTDVREPRLMSLNGTLTFLFFQAGINPAAFEPIALWRVTRKGLGDWSEPEKWGEPDTVPWDLKVRNGRAWLTSYRGNHYQGGVSDINVFFDASDDGVTWKPVKEGSRSVYKGGASEVAFEFDETGALWAVTRNEDGDASGFGSHLCTAPANDLAHWTCPAKSDPERYDSPEIIRHGKDLYLLARRDVGGPFDEGRTDLTFAQQQATYALDYWARPKRTTLYRIDRENRRIVALQDLPGAGDTAFASARRTGAHTFLVANYSSPLDHPDVSWREGQEGPTGIYLVTLTFEPR